MEIWANSRDFFPLKVVVAKLEPCFQLIFSFRLEEEEIISGKLWYTDHNLQLGNGFLSSAFNMCQSGLSMLSRTFFLCCLRHSNYIRSVVERFSKESVRGFLFSVTST